jgi:VWFA-related protein
MIRPACLLSLLCSPVALAFNQPTFSSRIEGVRVDVLVTDSSRRPMRGLTPADFVIRDNGVPQQVDVVSFGEIALNVGLAFDLSESVAGPRLEQLRRASKALTSELQPADQSALLTFNEIVSLRCPLSLDRSCVDRSLGATKPIGATALVDGVLAAMIASESDVGRSLLMVFSDGLDTSSFMNTDRVLETGRRSDVVVYSLASKEARPDFLEELSELTGGRLHEVERGEDLSKTFRAILDEFRYRYLVTYTPQGVPRDGWHKLEVRVNRPGARVKARPGYQGGRQ